MLTYLKKNLNLLSLFGIFLFLAGLFWNACHHGGDFKVFYLSGQRILNHLPIYQSSDGWSPFKYHPAWAIFFSLWAQLPLTLALFFFNAVNILFWTLSARHWARILNYKLAATTWFVLLFLALNALSAETAYGQINGFLFWGATQIFSWMEDEHPRPLQSGMLLALLISLKLHLGILACYLVYKNWRSALGLALGFLGLHLLTVVVFQDFLNLALYQSWLDLLLTQSKDQFFTYEVQSILRVCYVIFGESLAKVAWASLLGGVVLLGFYLDSIDFGEETRQKKMAYNGAYWLAVVFFFSPLAWWYQVLYLFPIAFLLLKNSSPKISQALIWLCLLTFAFVSFNTIGRQGILVFKLYMGYFIAGAVLFAFFLGEFIKKAFPAFTFEEARVEALEAVEFELFERAE